MHTAKFSYFNPNTWGDSKPNEDANDQQLQGEILSLAEVIRKAERDAQKLIEESPSDNQ